MATLGLASTLTIAQAPTRSPTRPASTVPRQSLASAPAVGALPPVTDTGTTVFEVGGVRVILRVNTANDVIAANLYLLGGVRLTTDEIRRAHV